MKDMAAQNARGRCRRGVRRLALAAALAHAAALPAREAADSIAAGAEGGPRTYAAGGFGGIIDRLSSSRLYRMTYIGVPLIAGGLIVKSEDDHFRSLRNDYMPRFNRHADDYMQFAPAAVMLGMKAAGVKSRSSWGRMLASDAFSALLMGCAVNTLKRTANVRRPDGSNRHSFPSGHTATAFMTAAMLAKEYDSPWIGAGAYATAAATGLMRMANNKHWLSDVLTGAGIGILSTETGYYLADLIFKDKGISRPPERDVSGTPRNPSFVSLYLGLNVPLSGYDIDERTEFSTSSGSAAGVEGAYFFSRHIGVGGRFVISNTSIIVNKKRAEHDTFDAASLCGGAYLSCPLSARWLAGGKLLGGYAHYPRLTLNDREIPARDGFCAGSGVSLTFKAKEHYGMSFFLDYGLLPSHSKSTGEYMNVLTFGTSFMILL